MIALAQFRQMAAADEINVETYNRIQTTLDLTALTPDETLQEIETAQATGVWRPTPETKEWLRLTAAEAALISAQMDTG